MPLEDRNEHRPCYYFMWRFSIADDSSIYFEHSDLDALTSHFNDKLKNVSTWLKANKLSINVKKTKIMIFRPRQKTLPVTRQIVLENNVLEHE